MEHFLMHWSSTLDPVDLATTLRNGILAVALLIFFALPSVLVLYSRKIGGKSRLAWFVVTMFLSWPAYIAFTVATRAKQAAPRDPDISAAIDPDRWG